MSERDFEAVLEEVNRGLAGSKWEHVRHDPHALWLGHFVSGVVLAIGLRPIEHMDSVVNIVDGVITGRVVVLTDSTIVFADAKAAVGDADAEMLVFARPKHDLVELTIIGGGEAYARTGFDPWPGEFQVTAKWSHGARVTFPLGAIENDLQRSRFMALYLALSEALGH